MNVFSMEVRNLRKGALVSTLSIGAVIFAMLAFFPAMQTEAMQALAGAKMEGIDPALLAALGLSELVDFTVITNFFGYVLQFITLAIMVIVTQRAVGLLIKEETDGTIEYLYAKPVSRTEIFCQKGLAHVVLFLASSVVWTIVTVTGYLLFSEHTLGEAVKEAAIFFSAIFLIGIIFSAVGVLLSALLKNGRATAGVTVAIVFGSFILGMMSVTVSGLDFLVWFSPMDWIKTAKLMSEGILWQEWLVGAGVILCGITAAWLRYRQKDLLV
ncbi:MAG: ABC transporter permease subunit [Oscillospiraceae bacterium]|nr:ABC transporter permease subunit [Oscillospiraceae bacterium]